MVAAAGRSTRMGRAKSLLDVDTPHGMQPLAVYLARTFLEGGATDVVITLPPTPEGVEIGAALAPHLRALADRVCTLPTAFDDEGLLGSVKTAITHAPSPPDVLLFTPVDAPFTTAPLVRALLATLGAHDAAAPLVAGQRGHPVAIARRLLPQFMAATAASAPDGARGILARARVIDVAYNDDAVILNVNTPAAWEAAAIQLASRLRSQDPD